MIFTLPGRTENDKAIAATLLQHVVEGLGQIVGLLLCDAHNAIGVAFAHIFAHRITIADDDVRLKTGIDTGIGRPVATCDIISVMQKGQRACCGREQAGRENHCRTHTSTAACWLR